MEKFNGNINKIIFVYGNSKGVKYMANIIDYIKWRGDLELKDSNFNEIDSLILNRFSYFPLDNIIGKYEILSIKELGKRFTNERTSNRYCI